MSQLKLKSVSHHVNTYNKNSLVFLRTYMSLVFFTQVLYSQV